MSSPKRLRLVTERRESPETRYTGAELRGLGDRELFHGSGFVARLRVVNPPSDETLAQVTRQFPVSVVSRSPKGESPAWIELGAPHAVPGEHKKHALLLFVVAMRLHRMDPRCRSMVHQIHGLAHLLQARIPGAPSVSTADRKKHEQFLKAEARLIVDGLTRHVLHQAGLPVAASTDLLYLTDEMIGKIHEELASDSNAGSEYERKAA